MSEPVTFLNIFEIPPDQVDGFVLQWHERARALSTQPGFRDARLLRATGDEARFQVINIAHWDSYEQWQAAELPPELREHQQASVASGVRPNIGFYRTEVAVGTDDPI